MAERETLVVDDPVRVNTAAELAGCLEGLRRRRRLSYEAMEQAARKLRPRPGEPRYEHLGKSTVGEIVTGRRLPTEGKLRTFLTICQIPLVDQVQWRAAWERARAADLARPDRAVRVQDARPRHIGVHAAIQVGGTTGDLPTYIPREIDDALRANLLAGTASGCFLLLIGGSSVGKTRTLYEAVLAVIPDWWLVQPADAQEIAGTAAAPTARTVLWLDELQRYLGGENGLTAACVRTLVRAGVVVVGTLWPDEYAARTALRSDGMEDPHARDRELLDMARVIDVADAFTAVENQNARSAAELDLRIQAALDSRDGGVTQVLAAGPEMVRRWEQAPDPYGRAVLTAAIDARRVGVTSPLTEDVVAAAVPGYLTPAQRATAPADWLQRALTYATTHLHGAAAALSPVPGDTMGQTAGYRASDFLFQHARRVRRTSPIPTTAWQSLVGYVTDFDDMYRLADSAYERGLYRYAEPVYRRIVDGRPWFATAAHRLTKMLDRQGRVDEAATLLRALGGYDAAQALAHVLSAHGRTDDAIKVLSPWVDAEEEGRYAAWVLAELYAEQGRDVEAIELLLPVGYFDSDEDPDRLSDTLRARLLAKMGRLDELRECAEEDSIAAEHLIQTLVSQGDLEGALSFLRDVIRSPLSDGWVIDRHAQLLAEHGRADEALDSDDWEFWPSLEVQVELYAEQGRFDQVDLLVDIVREHADSPLSDLPGLLASLGRFDELYARAQAGEDRAATKLADVLQDKEHTANAAVFLRSHGTDVLRDLAELLGRSDYVAEGIDLLQHQATAAGMLGTEEHAQTLVGFAERYAELNKLRAEADAGDHQAAAELTRILLALRDVDGLRAESRAGTEWSFLRLIDALVALGRHEEADQVRRFGFPTDE
ncbi:tetratricopeptide repeat protein [Actinokineospora sp. NPDC004072]